MLLSLKRHGLWGALFLLSLSFLRAGWWQREIEEENFNVPLLVPYLFCR